MDHQLALYQHWSWLPHFRAIAETQHLGEAARILRITPPALSRALQRLEGTLGTKLFDRLGRRLVLNGAGTTLLVAMRLAMRHIDDAINAVSTREQRIEVKIAAPGVYCAAVVFPALMRARRRWPELVGEVLEMPASVVSSLSSGEVDICLHEHPITSTELVSEPIYKLQKVVACAPAHAAARRRKLTVGDLVAYEFVAPPASPEGIRDDGWSVEVERRIGVTVANMQLGVDAVKTGGYLALLPRPIAVGSGLVPLQIRGLSAVATSIYASRRKPLATTADTIDRVVQLLREEIVRLDKQRY